MAPLRSIPRRARTLVVGLAAALAAAATLAAPASALDLIVLEGDPAVELSGTRSYGIVYIDGTLRLVGDTAINAAQVYIGPSAYFAPCFVQGGDDDDCTAGRSLTMNATGSLVFNPPIDLRSFNNGGGGPRPGGSLSLNAAEVQIGGSINTSGQGGSPSGSVTITSAGPIETQGISASGAAVKLQGAGGVSVTGDVSAQGTNGIPSADPVKAPAGGSVELSSSAGDVAVRGSINTFGVDTTTAGILGGAGGPVTVVGGDVRVGQVDTTGGTSTDQEAGPSGTIHLEARGSLHVLGTLFASGQNSTNEAPSDGSVIELSSAGHMVVVGATVSGGSGPLGGGGGGGGAITVNAGSGVFGGLSAAGGNATSSGTPGNGGAGGAIKVASPGALSFSSLTAYGGNAPANALGGIGGAIDVAGGSISTGFVHAYGGSSTAGSGVNGGSIRLSSETNMVVNGSVDSSGSNANGYGTPAYRGGAAGPLFLRAATGTLTLAGLVWAEGGQGWPDAGAGPGGAGGAGAQIEIVAHAVGSFLGISADGGSGGDFGDQQGPGGNGGAVRAWTDSPIFDATKVVSGSGGDGNPIGKEGAQIQESSPTSLAIDAVGALTFTSRSPDAQGYRVLRSVNGGATEVVLEAASPIGIKVPLPLCTPVAFTVVAFHGALGWISDAPPGVSVTAQPSSTQKCSDPPAVTAKSKTVKITRKKLKKAKWKVRLNLSSAGIGSLAIELRAKKKKLASMTSELTQPGTLTVILVLPKRAHKPGLYTIQLESTAPDGKAKARSKLTLEVLP